MLKPNSPVTANLIKARELIADIDRWCIGAREDFGGKRCALGALDAVRGSLSPSAEDKSGDALALGRAALMLFPNNEYLHPNDPVQCVADVNNMIGHAATMRMFDKAIELSLQD